MYMCMYIYIDMCVYQCLYIYIVYIYKVWFRDNIHYGSSWFICSTSNSPKKNPMPSRSLKAEVAAWKDRHPQATPTRGAHQK